MNNRKDKIEFIIKMTKKYLQEKMYYEDAIKEEYYKDNTDQQITWIYYDMVILMLDKHAEERERQFIM